MVLNSQSSTGQTAKTTSCRAYRVVPEDDETPLEATRRESWEEARIDPDTQLAALDSTETIPASNRKNSGWGDDVYVIRNYYFGTDIGNQTITLSEEHTEFRWLPLHGATTLLRLQSDTYALSELGQRIQR